MGGLSSHLSLELRQTPGRQRFVPYCQRFARRRPTCSDVGLLCTLGHSERCSGRFHRRALSGYEFNCRITPLSGRWSIVSFECSSSDIPMSAAAGPTPLRKLNRKPENQPSSSKAPADRMHFGRPFAGGIRCLGSAGEVFLPGHGAHIICTGYHNVPSDSKLPSAKGGTRIGEPGQGKGKLQQRSYVSQTSETEKGETYTHGNLT